MPESAEGLVSGAFDIATASCRRAPAHVVLNQSVTRLLLLSRKLSTIDLLTGAASRAMQDNVVAVQNIPNLK